MQYILTQAEYDELRAKQKLDLGMQTDQLQTLCTLIADTMPVRWGCMDEEPKPYRCILTTEGEHYCDECPMQEICPYKHKEWSK